MFLENQHLEVKETPAAPKQDSDSSDKDDATRQKEIDDVRRLNKLDILLSLFFMLLFVILFIIRL